MGGGISSSLEPPPIFTRRVPKWEVAKMGGVISSSLEPPPVFTRRVLVGYQRRPQASRAWSAATRAMAMEGRTDGVVCMNCIYSGNYR